MSGGDAGGAWNGPGLLAAAVLLAACAGKPHENYVAGELSWRAEREVSLSSPDSYLGLVALIWVGEGRQTVGSSDDADLRFEPAYAPADLGVLEVDGERVVFEPADGVVARRAGETGPGAIERIELVTDAQGAPTRVQVGELVFWIIDRGGRLAIRARHPDSAVLAAYRGTDRWMPDPAWRVEAAWRPYARPRAVDQPNVLGGSYADEAAGELVFTLAGAEHVLEPTGEPGALFLVFGDETNGGQSYGGGRFLRVEGPDEEGLAVIDFNRAYNPPCAYTPHTTCPLPLPRNRLPVAVTAGERAPE